MQVALVDTEAKRKFLAKQLGARRQSQQKISAADRKKLSN